MADGYFALPGEDDTYTVVTADQITSGVTIQGIAGYEHSAFATVEDATAATHILALCTKLVCIDKLLSEEQI